MESNTYIKNLKISPKKLRFLLPEIKKLKPVDALEQLFYQQTKSAKIFYKAIKSAVSNAKLTLKTSEDLLKFNFLTVEEGRKLKRFQPGAKGMVKPILKRYAHIKIALIVDKAKPIKLKKNINIEKDTQVQTKSNIKNQKSKRQIKS